MQAMIFCAGLGTRFKPWTDHHPKALAVINDKSLLQRNIEYLQKHGINNVVVNVHHFSNQIVAVIDANKGWGSKVLISDETDAVLETGGGLLHAKKLFEDHTPFLTYNVDILTDINLTEMIDHHSKSQSLITLAVSDRKTSRKFLFDEDNQLCGWENQATGQQRMSRQSLTIKSLAYSGIAIFNYEVFDSITFSGKFSLVDLYLDLAKNKKIVAWQHTTEKWIDVGKPESVAIAEKLFI